ncbi:MAG TPA: choice-of-anchor D domain-containing protein, partial [Thermoanaerobaculia bacterium]|nr:choice-of-anchor D domain-containing protein [Thermoanaerobaculia bacterium]
MTGRSVYRTWVLAASGLFMAVSSAWAAPAISVQQGTTSIAKGSTYVYPASTPVGTPTSVQFTITNTGNTTLNISNPTALVAGGSAFSLIINAPSSIPAGGNGVFRVRLQSATSGTFTGTVTIHSDAPGNTSFAFNVQGTVTGPTISVQQGTAAIAKGSTYVYPASTPAGTPTSVQFTITNTGTATLNISNPTALVAGGSAFSLIINAPSSIPAGGNGVFRVRLQSATGGTFTGTISINSDDSANNPFTFYVQGTVTAPLIGVLQGSTAVAKGSTFVYPGSTPAGVVYWLPFTITNSGSATLNISNPTALVTNGGGAFSLTVSAPASIAAGSSGNFRVRLLSGTPGTYTGTVTINSDDPVNPTYSFNLQGTVAAAPAIGVQKSGSAIASGATYIFPSTPAGLAESLTFTVTNTGGATLSISNPSTLLTGSSAFSLTAAAPASIAAGGSGTFVVRLLSATPGTYTATVTINSNDPVTNPFTFTLQGTVNPASAISVQQGTTSVAKGSTFIFPASTPAGTPTSVQFTITNTGGATLNISNPTALVVGGSAFSLIINAPSSIPAGGNGIFRVRLQSATGGTFTGTVSISSDDPLNNPFTFNVQGTVTAPLIGVLQGATAVAKGSTFVYPGSTPAGVVYWLPFTITNTGSATLNISNPTALVTNGGGAFSLTVNAPASIAAGSSGNFRVRLLSGTPGTYTGTVTINSDDPVNPAYSFNLQGTVAAAPAIGVLQGGSAIASGATFTFPSTPAGAAESLVFTITNTGGATLNISNPSTLVSGNSAFSLTAAAPASIVAGGSGSFVVRLLSATPGTYTATVTINSNDPVTNPFTFTLQGTVNPAPAIGVQQGTTNVAKGSTFVYPASTPAGTPTSVQFTIANSGGATLNISNPTALVVGGSAFSLIINAPSSIPAGGNGVFRVRLLSATPGTFTGTVSIASDDPLNNPFTFTVQGTVDPAAAISVQQGATAIANGGSFTFPAGTLTGVPL